MYALLAFVSLFGALMPTGPNPVFGPTGIAFVNAFGFAAALYFTIQALIEEKK